MFIWTLQTIIVSIIFIFLVHNLFTFFKSTLTVPKTKDLVNSSSQKYENIFNILNNRSKNNTNNNNNNCNNEMDMLPDATQTGNPYGTNISDLPTNKDANPSQHNAHPNANNANAASSMKNELKLFLKKQLNT